MNHENTKSKKHEMFRKIFVFSFFRDGGFLIRRWMFDVQFRHLLTFMEGRLLETDKVTTLDQDMTLLIPGSSWTPFSFSDFRCLPTSGLRPLVVVFAVHMDLIAKCIPLYCIPCSRLSYETLLYHIPYWYNWIPFLLFIINMLKLEWLHWNHCTTLFSMVDAVFTAIYRPHHHSRAGNNFV